MSEQRFFTKINKNGRNVIIDKECHTELFDMTLACEVLNRLDLKLKTYNEQLGEQQATISALKEENEQLQQIMKDIVVATDETYAKNMSMFKVTVVLDYEKYREIKECLYE